MSAATVTDQLCVYFGGPYEAATRTYRTPQVAGLGVVRRAWAKRDDHADYTLNVPGVQNGCQMVVQLTQGTERRIAVGGAVHGRKYVQHAVSLHCFIRSTAPYAEDAQDYAYGLLDAIRAHIQADRTCGSGGFEAGGFQVGEGGEPWLRWTLHQARTTAELTKSYLLVEFDADEIIDA